MSNTGRRFAVLRWFAIKSKAKARQIGLARLGRVSGVAPVPIRTAFTRVTAFGRLCWGWYFAGVLVPTVSSPGASSP